jgi:hypothetical protein
MAGQHVPKEQYRPVSLRIKVPHRLNKIAQARAGILGGIVIAASLVSFVLPVSAQTATDLASHSFDFSYVVRVVPPENTHTMRMWIPVPSSDQFQTISQIQVKGPARIRMDKDSKYGNRYAHLSVSFSRSRTPVEVRLTFHVIRYERRMELMAVTGASKSFPKDVISFLRPDALVPWDSAKASVARDQTEGLADPLQKARKIYEYVISTSRYAPCVVDGGAADADHDNCADFYPLLIGMARAAGIPARLEIGFSVPEGQQEGTILGYQSWSEFYVNRIGWVPFNTLDTREATDMRQSSLGTLDARRVMLSIGETATPNAGPPRAYPYVEMDGQPYLHYSTSVLFHESGTVSASPSKKPIFAEVRRVDGHRSVRLPS